MIQNLENKMELQTNNLETRIEKMHGMFNKDVEEFKKTQSIINNAINEIKTLWREPTVEKQAEDSKSEVEYKIEEINEAERKQEKRIKTNEENFRDLWDNVKHPNIRFLGVTEEDDKKKGHE